jgi:hypothetical protein
MQQQLARRAAVWQQFCAAAEAAPAVRTHCSGYIWSMSGGRGRRRLRALAEHVFHPDRRDHHRPGCALSTSAVASPTPTQAETRGTASLALYEALEREGFCVVPDVLPPSMIRRLRDATDSLIDTERLSDGPFSSRRLFRSQGSMIAVPGHRDADGPRKTPVAPPLDPLFGELITWAPALDALVQMGWPLGGATFTDGYIISKPPQSPPLFWHYDWFSWEIEVDYARRPPQLFFMYYLHDTTVRNGCLRVLPRTHYTHHTLHEALENPHNAEYSRAEDPSSVPFAEQPGEVSVMVNAGDLVFGDSRMLHAAHANQSDSRRTVITLWIQPDFNALPLKTQAQMLLKTHRVPVEWTDDQQFKLRAMQPPAHWDAAGHGDVHQVVAREVRNSSWVSLQFPPVVPSLSWHSVVFHAETQQQLPLFCHARRALT